VPPSRQPQSRISVIVAVLSAIVLGILWLAIIQNIRGHQGKEAVSAGSGRAGDTEREPVSAGSGRAGVTDTNVTPSPALEPQAPLPAPPPERPRLEEVPPPKPAPTRQPAARAVTPQRSRQNQATRLPTHKGLAPECMAELEQLCPESSGGEGRRQCFQEKEGNLSDACQGQLHAMAVRITEGVQSFKNACELDIKRFCANVQPGGGRILQCLEDRYQEVSDPCYQTLTTKPLRK
jgi:cysteine rich repeat protein